MGDYKARIGANGRIVIPAEVRHALGIEPGDELVLRVEKGELRVVTRKALIKRAQELVAKYATGEDASVDAFLAERKRLWGED